MDEPCSLPFPEEAGEALPHDRTGVERHRVRVNVKWWNKALSDQGQPGQPLAVTYEDGDLGISRDALFELAADESDDGVLLLLWHTLAWGGGMRVRLMNKRLDIIGADRAHAASALRASAAAARTSPADAYESLYPHGRTLFKYLGPAFFTKYLYFAGCGAATHPCVILDRVTADALRARGWSKLRTSGWSKSTYVQYCQLLARWALAASNQIGRTVAPDEIEFWLFKTADRS